MTSEQLRQFKTIAECQSMTKAAEKLYISQPALSIAINKLEDELSAKLFERRDRKLFLTKQGEVLLGYASTVCEAIDRAIDYFTVQADSTLMKAYRIGGTSITLLTEGCFDTQQHRLNCILKLNAELPAVIRSEAADIVIADARYMTEDLTFNLEEIFLYRQKLLLSVGKDDPLAAKGSITLKELQKVPLVGYTNPVGIESWIHDVEEMNHIQLNEVLSMDHLAWFNQKGNLPWPHLMSSFGVSTAKTFFKDRRLIPVEGEYTERSIYLWYPKRRKQMLQVVVDKIKENAEKISRQDKRFFRQMQMTGMD